MRKNSIESNPKPPVVKTSWKAAIAIALLVGAMTLFLFYQILQKPMVCEDFEIKIYPNTPVDSLIKTLNVDACFRAGCFAWAYRILGMGPTLPNGKYAFTSGMSAAEIIKTLKSRKQKPAQVVIQNGRTLEDLCQQLGLQLMEDSSSMQAAFYKKIEAEDFGHFTKENLLTLVIPNTYEIYWNSHPDQVVNRLIKEHQTYWNKEERKEKLAEIGLTEIQAYILASIVEKESTFAQERATIAGLYLNRLKIGMPLQADPTVIFAIGDFQIRRVLKKHLSVDSPYNTYLYAGLPPGPICMPSLNSLNAVIQPEQHNFLYMCALPGYEGKHAFAKNFEEHSRNAVIYRKWLNQQGIKR
jgi:UPF0755 protein